MGNAQIFEKQHNNNYRQGSTRQIHTKMSINTSNNTAHLLAQNQNLS